MQASVYRVADLGELAGDVLLFGGPHSNLQASRALLDVAANRNIPAGNRICTGDVIAYCANPVETLHLLQSQCVLVAGNCEKQLASGAGDCGFEPGSDCEILSRQWYPFASAQLSRKDRKFLARTVDMAVFSAFGRRFAVIHGGLSDISKYLWPTSTDDEFSREIAYIQNTVGPLDGIIAGHCGIAFHRQINGLHWFNPGAIGIPPHDGNAETCYGLLTASGLQIKRLSYDNGAASAAMQSAGLVQGYDAALLSGYWPSEDILPAALRRQASPASG